MKIKNIKINKKDPTVTEAELLKQLKILSDAYYSMDLSRKIKRGIQARKEALLNGSK